MTNNTITIKNTLNNEQLNALVTVATKNNVDINIVNDDIVMEGSFKDVNLMLKELSKPEHGMTAMFILTATKYASKLVNTTVINAVRVTKETKIALATDTDVQEAAMHIKAAGTATKAACVTAKDKLVAWNVQRKLNKIVK